MSTVTSRAYTQMKDVPPDDVEAAASFYAYALEHEPSFAPQYAKALLMNQSTSAGYDELCERMIAIERERGLRTPS